MRKVIVAAGLVALSCGGVSAFATGRDVSAPADHQVVVRQGTAALTLTDVDAYAHTVPQGGAAQLFASPNRVEQVLLNLLQTRQLADEARKAGLDKDRVIAAEMQQASDGALAAARIAALKQHFTDTMPNMDELAHERYLANPSSFDLPKQVDVKHILIGTKDRSEGEAKALADKLYSELKANPSGFDADVEKYSDDPSKKNNHGLIENATSDGLVKPFRDAANSLSKVGQVLPPVKSQFGYHIIEAVKITPAKTRSFEEVRPELITQLQNDYVARKVRDHVDGLRGNKLEPNMDLVKSLTTRYATSPAAAASTK